MSENIAEEYSAAWKKIYDIIIDAGAFDEFVIAMKKSAELASRAAAATYDNERVHLKMSVRAEFCYEMVDGANGALEASETRARVEEAERIRQELTGS